MISLPRSPRGHVLVAAAAFCGITLSTHTSAQSLETFVMTAGGISNSAIGGPGCGMYGPPPEAFTYFGTANLYIPGPGLSACGIAGASRWTPTLTGPARDSMALTTTFGVGIVNSVATDTRVAAQNRLLSATAHSNFTGAAVGSTVVGSSGFAVCHDNFTIDSPAFAAGQTGWLRVWVRVTGGLSCTGGRGTADVELNYRVGSQPVSFLFRSQADNTVNAPALFSTTGKGLTNFMLSPGVVSGSGEVDTRPAPFTFGTPFNFSLMLLAFTGPIQTGTTDVSFRAWISRIEVLDASQQPVPFTMTAASGTSYSSSLIDAPKNAPLPIWPIAPVMLQKLAPLWQ